MRTAQRIADLFAGVRALVLAATTVALTLLVFSGSALASSTPVIESESVSNITPTDATLEAKINPENVKSGALYQFQLVGNPNEYFSTFVCPPEWAGSSLCLGLDTEAEGLPFGRTDPGTEGQTVSLDLAHAGRVGVTLKPGTTYHYRVVAATSVFTEDTTQWEGPTVEGSDQTFTTPPVGKAPVIESVSLSHLTSTDATLEATIDTEGLSTSYEFQMWSSPCSKHGSGCELLIDVPLPSGLLLGSFVDQSVSLDLNSAGVTLGDGEYGYSVRAISSGGETEGQWQTFEAPTERPVGSSSGPFPPPPAPATPEQAPAPSAGSQPTGSGGSQSSSTPSSSPTSGVGGVLGAQVGRPAGLKPLAREQRLAKVLKACEKKSKNRRAACEAKAHKLYGPSPKHVR